MNDARTDELHDGGDDDSEELEAIENDDPENQYYWTENKDEWRRSFVFEHMANVEIDIHIMISNMELALKWLKDGTVPVKEGEKAPKRGLKSL